jgi:hypothetical protein
VMLTPPGDIEIDFRPLGSPLRLGQAIGRIGCDERDRASG